MGRLDIELVEGALYKRLADAFNEVWDSLDELQTFNDARWSKTCGCTLLHIPPIPIPPRGYSGETVSSSRVLKKELEERGNNFDEAIVNLQQVFNEVLKKLPKIKE